jgi:hypothetical protein
MFSIYMELKRRYVVSMKPRERIMAVLDGDEPDKTPVSVESDLTTLFPGGWYRRLKDRGLGTTHGVKWYTPAWGSVTSANPRLPDVKYTQIHYFEKGIWKYRHTYETPVGSITGVMMINPMSNVSFIDSPEEYLIKQPADWNVVNYILKSVIDKLTPIYEDIKRAEDQLGDDGIVIAMVPKTAWQRAWTILAGPERSAIDFHERPEEVQEYIELDKRFHTRLAEFAAECPAKCIDIVDNISDMISPKYWREFCLPVFEIYRKQLEGTGKVLAVHMDGRLGHLRKEIAEAPINVVESFAVPPTGDISLTEVKKIWPDKLIFMNTANHLAWAKPEEVRKGYEELAGEWGSKKGLLLELMEELPLETVEAHMSAALDAFGY